MNIAAIAFAALVLAALAPSASAQSLRCRNDLASAGDSKASVYLKCGEPVLKDSFCKPAVPGAPTPNPTPGATVVVAPCENVEEWTYKPGYGQFVTTLRFEAGVLVSIRYGDRIR